MGRQMCNFPEGVQLSDQQKHHYEVHWNLTLALNAISQSEDIPTAFSFLMKKNGGDVSQHILRVPVKTQRLLGMPTPIIQDSCPWLVHAKFMQFAAPFLPKIRKK